MSMTYDLTRRFSMAFVHLLYDHEVEELVERLKERVNDIALPMLLPMMLLETRTASVTAKMLDIYSELLTVEKNTGLRANWHPNHPGIAHLRSNGIPAGPLRNDGVDLDQAIVDLTSIQSKLGYVEYQCQLQLPILEEFMKTNARIISKASAEAASKLGPAEERQEYEVSFLKATVLSAQARTAYLAKRSQAKVQTVGYLQMH